MSRDFRPFLNDIRLACEKVLRYKASENDSHRSAGGWAIAAMRSA
jgi:hypothetical protein